ncbi:MAG: histidine phosphatase family protein [Lactobacillus sp.]|jgi:probable phosphoglycerate mutase|nr:histidine phosphatase family protein [Lactobacillus sp.]MCH3905774.1 histidine phosphatase family protein [Lactobacillus sp.]MCH3990654.1 histidine phosphatase family protein [Lactobacillus sp.]MCH4068630.1 histidine phosphatase family protein [Lactobacillus sp.]MCI1304525.1 histidine phosphatase family protein [Lactobacillus sp.]
MELIIIRHGQTDLNKQSMIQGSEVDAPLNQAGIAFAQASAENFDASDFAAVYVSPLKRAVQTAQIFTKNQAQLIYDERLKEMDYGSWDGHSVAEMKAKYPECFDSWGFIRDNYSQYATGGESFAELEKRCASFLDDLTKKYDQEKILVVCHGATSRMLVAHLFMGGSAAHLHQMDNCGLTKIEFAGTRPELIYYNRVLA